MSIKAHIVSFLSAMAVGGPWRLACEKILVSVAHKHPNSRVVTSFCRHFGLKLIKREGREFSRYAVFETGGRMYCGGEALVAQVSLFYYFFGNITNVHTADEQGMVRLLRRVVRRGDIFFDLGANFGFYSCYVVPLCGRSGEVHAFEPNPSLIPLLRQSRELNHEYGSIYVNAVAVGKETKKYLPLYGTDQIGESSLYAHEWLRRESVTLVPIVTIDEYVNEKRIERIDVMKIDIEGAELDAFRGMEETFQICPPKLILCELTVLPEESDPLRRRSEALGRSSSAADAAQLAEFLRQKGYELWGISADGRLCTWKAPRLTTDCPLALINVAFVRPELQLLRPEIFSCQAQVASVEQATSSRQPGYSGDACAVPIEPLMPAK